MNTYKRVLPLLLALVLLLGCIPATVARATEEEDGVITRAQWLQQLVTTFGYTVDEDVVQDNYYPDLSSEAEYYNDVLTAMYYGLVDLLPNEELRPDDPATREFAAYTLNACMGYLPMSDEYSYTDAVTYPGDVQVAVERGWFALSDGAFLPDQAITAEERDLMIADAQAYVAEFTIGDEVEQSYAFKPGVVEITEPANIETVEDKTVITVTNCAKTVGAGDIFVVYADGLAIPYKAESVSLEANRTVITAGEAFFEDAIEDMNVRMETEANPANFYTAEGSELIFIEESTGDEYTQEAVVNALARGSFDKYIPKYSHTISAGEGISIKVTAELKNNKLSYDICVLDGVAAVWFETDAEVTASATCNFNKMTGDDCEVWLGGYSVPGVGGLDIYLKFDVTGTISVVKKYHMKAGVKIDVDMVGFARWKTKKEMIVSVTELGSTMNAEISTKVYLQGKFGLTGKALPVKGYFYAEAGFKASAKYTTYSEIPGHCTHFSAYVFAKYGVKVDYDMLGDKDTFDWSQDIYKESNSPVKISQHYEDGNQVSGCTRKNLNGTVTGSTTKIEKSGYRTNPKSFYYNSGISSMTSSRGYNEKNEPIIIYKYDLDEENKATITSYSGNATSLTIPLKLDGYDVVAIGEKAFQDQTGLKTVIMQDNILTIGSRAFENCSGLRNLTLSENLTTIDDNAFRNCTALTEVHLPDTMQLLGIGAFQNCTALIRVHIPKDMVAGDYAGSDVYPGPFYGCSKLSTITFGKDITAIPSGLFHNCTGLRKLEVPETVTEIGSKAFKECTNLENIKLPRALTVIGAYAFSDCTALREVTLPAGMEVIWNGAFEYCTALTKINIPKDMDTAEYAGSDIYPGPFYGCSSLNDITFDEGITRIPEGLFHRCTGLKAIEIPNTITSIQSDAFTGCTELKNVTFSNALTNLGSYAFSGCTALTEVMLPASLEELSYGAFENCTALTKINIPKGMDTAEYAGSDVYPGPFIGCSSLNEIAFEDGIDRIPKALFFGCPGLKNIEIPKTVKDIHRRAFYNCYSLESIILPENLVSIGEQVFAYCNALKSVQIPDSVTSIGDGTFINCISLTDIHLPDICTNIVPNMFERCTSLVRIELPKTVTTLQDDAFKSCISLQEVVWSEKLTKVEDNVFNNCDGLTAFGLPATVTKIGDSVFYDCDGLKTIILSDSITEWGTQTFYDCDALTDVYLGWGLTSIPNSTFEHCDVLATLTVPYRVTKIGEHAFKHCVAFASITIPRATTEISSKAFSYPDIMTIYGVSGTYAETYAKEQSIKFVHQEVKATAVSLSDQTLTLNNGQSAKLYLTVEPGNFTDAVAWKSSDTAVVTVNDSGEVKAVGAGTADIKVTVGSVSATCTVTVVQPVTSIRLNKSSQTLEALATYQLKATVRPDNAANNAVVWTSSDPNVATVDENGLVTAIAKGTATITVTAADGSGVSDSCTFTVTNNGYAVTDPVQMESTHNYPDASTDFWLYTLEGAEKLAVTFDSRTMIEKGFDYLYIYGVEKDKFVEIGKYTGGELAGVTVEITGDTVKIQLVSDDSGNEWGFKVTEIKSVALHEHSYNPTVTAPTCTEGGYTTYTCECGDSYVADEVPMLDHSWNDGEITKQPTEDADGVKTFTCTRCGETKTEILPKLDHVHKYEAEVTAPTCLTEGYTMHTCACGDKYVDNRVEPLGHDMGEWIVKMPASCILTGLEERFCSRCDHVERQTIPLNDDHNWNDGEITRQPTEDADGVKTFTCTRCGKTKTEILPKLDHVHAYEAEVTAPSCTEGGYTTYTCACGDSYVADEVPAQGHKQSDTTVTVDPDCKSGGYTSYWCPDCGGWFTTNETPALGHEFRDGTCTRCGEDDPSYEKPVENPFSDVKETDYFLNPVLWAVENGITSGTGNGQFSPNNTCTRGQVVTFLWRAMGQPEPKLTVNPFSDVSASDYFYKPVLWALENGITSGTSATTFAPNNPCSRDQVVTFLWRAMDKPTPEKQDHPFSDVPANAYYYQPVLWALENGITSGTSATTFSPSNPCTRGQVVTFLYRAMNKQ